MFRRDFLQFLGIFSMVPSAIFVKENNVFNMIISSDLFKLYINLNTNKMEWIEIDSIKYYNDAFNSINLDVHYSRNNFDFVDMPSNVEQYIQKSPLIVTLNIWFKNGDKQLIRDDNIKINILTK